MISNTRQKLKNIAIKAAKEAGKILMKYYGKVKEEYKGKRFDVGTILTKADIESEKKILRILKKEFPDHNFYSEEEGWTKKVLNSEYTWYIDPLDGTSNFSKSIPLFGISIGLIKNNNPLLGVLFFPTLNLLVHAENEKGAFANGKKIHVSNRTIEKSLYYAGGRFKGKFQIEESVAKKVCITKIIDASSFEFAQIAMGDAELYMLVSVMHDVAAGVIIVREAGGKVTDKKGKEWTLNSKYIIASNKKIHKEVVDILKK